MRRSFSLVELAMALAITMTLAAVAVPLFAEAQLKARKAELGTVVDGLYSAAHAHHAATDALVLLPFGPDALPGRDSRPWDGVPEIGYQVDGGVRGSYTIVGFSGIHCFPVLTTALSCNNAACVSGMSDIDADFERSCVRATDADATLIWTNPTLY